MGLLDDAIREHLELKRLHGAPASEVLREEREVFDFEVRTLARTRPASLFDGAEIHAGDARPHLSQDTVEFDMQAVLGA